MLTNKQFRRKVRDTVLAGLGTGDRRGYLVPLFIHVVRGEPRTGVSVFGFDGTKLVCRTVCEGLPYEVTSRSGVPVNVVLASLGVPNAE